MTHYVCGVNPDGNPSDEVKMGRDPRSHQVFITQPLEERLGDVAKLKQQKRFSYRIGDALNHYFMVADANRGAVLERFTMADIVVLRTVMKDVHFTLHDAQNGIARAVLASELPDKEYQESLFNRILALSPGEQLALHELITGPHPDES